MTAIASHKNSRSPTTLVLSSDPTGLHDHSDLPSGRSSVVSSTADPILRGDNTGNQPVLSCQPSYVVCVHPRQTFRGRISGSAPKPDRRPRSPVHDPASEPLDDGWRRELPSHSGPRPVRFSTGGIVIPSWKSKRSPHQSTARAAPLVKLLRCTTQRRWKN